MNFITCSYSQVLLGRIKIVSFHCFREPVAVISVLHLNEHIFIFDKNCKQTLDEKFKVKNKCYRTLMIPELSFLTVGLN
jgi:hypothetical protein